jgi:AraC-like DNA-binding protein
MPTWTAPALEVPAGTRATFEVLAAELVAEQARAGDARQAPILDHLLRTFVLQAERLKMEAGTAMPDALERFFEILERDHARTRSVAHYARAAGISPRRLGELLAERTGKTTKQIIDERVVLECKRRLAHTDVTVKELADQLGFDEPTNLVKFFRRHASTTPIAFRDAQRGS